MSKSIIASSMDSTTDSSLKTEKLILRLLPKISTVSSRMIQPKFQLPEPVTPDWCNQEALIASFTSPKK